MDVHHSPATGGPVEDQGAPAESGRRSEIKGDYGDIAVSLNYNAVRLYRRRQRAGSVPGWEKPAAEDVFHRRSPHLALRRTRLVEDDGNVVAQGCPKGIPVAPIQCPKESREELADIFRSWTG